MFKRFLPKLKIEKTTRQDSNDDFPPKPKWKPNIEVDLPRIIQTFSRYLNYKSPFAVFANGTCVGVVTHSNNMEPEATATLDKVYRAHPDFTPLAMDDGNWVIRYSQPTVFSIVFKDEIEKNWDYIEKYHLEGLTPHEVLLNKNGEPNKFDATGKIGLFARARMFMDAQSPRVIKLWTPTE